MPYERAADLGEMFQTPQAAQNEGRQSDTHGESSNVAGDLSWDDWWPLDNSLLDQGIYHTLTNNADTELQNILDSLFESSA